MTSVIYNVIKKILRFIHFLFQGECDKSYGADFVFSDHSKELIVGEIFVRVYNEQPTFQLEVNVI